MLPEVEGLMKELEAAQGEVCTHPHTQSGDSEPTREMDGMRWAMG